MRYSLEDDPFPEEEDAPCCIGFVTSGGDDRCHVPGCYDELPRTPSPLDYAEADQEWANRWSEAWDLLEKHGIVSSPEDDSMTLAELERLKALLT